MNTAPSRPAHLLCINHEFPPAGGGAATATQHIARALAQSGMQVTVLTGRYGKQVTKEVQDGVTLWRIPAVRAHHHKSNPWEMITFLLSSCWWALRHGHRLRATACIAFFGLPAGPAAWILKSLWGVPYIISLRGGDVPGFLPEQMHRWHQLTGGCIRWLWRHAHAVVANSQGLAQLARKDGQTVDVIPNGVDTEAFAPAAEEPAPAAVTHFLHVGRLNKQKSLDTLLHALPLLRSPWRLTLAGDGPEASALKELARTLGVADRISFLGWQERSTMTPLYQSAHAFVFPSVDEGMPNAVLEAMSCGLPVVACAVAGCEELVESGRNGTLIPPRDTQALAAALQYMCDHPQERLAMGRAGRRIVCEHFSWHATAHAYARICIQE